MSVGFAETEAFLNDVSFLQIEKLEEERITLKLQVRKFAQTTGQK